MDAVVFNIARCSLHDGEGIRTVVYLKGCSLRCRWCHNPEGISPAPEVLFRPSRCIGCGRCAKLCPDNHPSAGGAFTYRREGCAACMQCAGACPNEALVACGRRMGAREVAAEVLKDKHYYDASGGGVTFSGGECLLQPDFLCEALRLCREAGVHTAVESAMHVPWGAVAAVAPWTDAFLVDIKLIDGEAHRRWTGSDNLAILENIRRLSHAHPAVTVRVPLVPAVTDGDGNLAGIAAFVNGCGEGIRAVELLRFNPLAAGKYEALGLRAEPFAGRSQEDGEMEDRRAFLQALLTRRLTVTN